MENLRIAKRERDIDAHRDAKYQDARTHGPADTYKRVVV